MRLAPAAAFLLAAGAALAEPNITLCESCHGPRGNSVQAGVPSIAGQPVIFLENQLVYFREQLRHAPVMQGVVKGMKDEEFTALAKHFSAQKATVVAQGAADAGRMAKGRELAGKLHCGQCHMPQFQGQGQMARLAGQREDYLLEALTEYRDGKRSAADTTMTEVLGGTTDDDLKALAHFLAHSL